MIGFTVNSNNNIKAGDKAYRSIPFDCTLVGWYIDSTETGNLQVDVKTGAGVSLIGGGTTPAMVGASSAEGFITDWDTMTLGKGDVILFNVPVLATVKNMIFSLAIEAL
jgi:hypothetical protein